MVETDGMKKFNPTAMDDKLCVIFDVRCIKLEFNKKLNEYTVVAEAPETSKCLWGILPIGTALIPTEAVQHMLCGVYKVSVCVWCV